MQSDGSVTHWIDQVKEGDGEAAQALWERYFTRLVEAARSRLQGTVRAMADEEDVALSVIDSFCRAAEQGRFPELAGRDGLWRLLVRMTARKVVDQRRRESRQRRGGGNVLREEALAAAELDVRSLAEVADEEPTPEFVVLLAERVERLLDHLGDEDLKTLTIGRLEGYTNEELAKQLGCSLRTVERRLRLVREICKQEVIDVE
jgi:RNA polymerase sigma factor (sigma-70 family)